MKLNIITMSHPNQNAAAHSRAAMPTRFTEDHHPISGSEYRYGMLHDLRAVQRNILV
jgi:hypothetical protein